MITFLPYASGIGAVPGVVFWMRMGVLCGSGRCNLLALCVYPSPFFLSSSNLKDFCGFLPPVFGSIQVDAPEGNLGGSLLVYSLRCPLSSLFS